MKIYHIAEKEAWEKALKAGVYEVASLESEGFIHCSAESQVEGVANAFYKGRDDLVLLVIDSQHLTSELYWESPAHPDPEKAGEIDESIAYPHIYGPLNMGAVIEAKPFKSGEDEAFSFNA